MNLQTITSTLIGVVKDIQQCSGDVTSMVSGSTCPLKDLPSFDSIICVETITVLSISLGIEIADNINIFVAEDGKRLLTIDEASALVYEGLNKGEK